MQLSAKTRPAITMTKWICNGGYSAVGAATCPFFLSRVIAGVGALALAGGLIVFTSGQDETKPAPLTGQQEVAAVPAPDSRDAESTSGPARAGLPPEPARNAASSSAPTPEPPAENLLNRTAPHSLNHLRGERTSLRPPPDRRLRLRRRPPPA